MFYLLVPCVMSSFIRLSVLFTYHSTVIATVIDIVIADVKEVKALSIALESFIY